MRLAPSPLTTPPAAKIRAKREATHVRLDEVKRLSDSGTRYLIGDGKCTAELEVLEVLCNILRSIRLVVLYLVLTRNTPETHDFPNYSGPEIGDL